MKLGLALAGGGVKGAAHIGAIKALEENGIKIDAVGGTSIGSIVSSLYAMGYSTEKMLEIFKYFAKGIMKADARYFAGNLKTTKRLLGNGLLSGENIEIAIEECAKEKNYKNIKSHIKYSILYGFLYLVHQEGFEPPTFRFVAEHSIQLSYWCIHYIINTFNRIFKTF